jgi:hypothetical protein
LEVGSLARSRVEPVSDGVEIVLGISAELRALGQVLVDEAVHVLVAGGLPGTVAIGEIDFDADGLGQLGMPGDYPRSGVTWYSPQGASASFPSCALSFLAPRTSCTDVIVIPFARKSAVTVTERRRYLPRPSARGRRLLLADHGRVCMGTEQRPNILAGGSGTPRLRQIFHLCLAM